MTTTILVIVLLVGLNLGQTCHPECRFQCDDPVWPAVCKIITQPPKCIIQCSGPILGTPLQYCGNLTCAVHQPAPDQCQMDQCPIVEITCLPLVCVGLPNGVSCEPLCEAPVAAWSCTPGPLPPITCIPVCDKPACEATSNTTKRTQSQIGLIMLLFLLLNYAHWFLSEEKCFLIGFVY